MSRSPEEAALAIAGMARTEPADRPHRVTDYATPERRKGERRNEQNRLGEGLMDLRHRVLDRRRAIAYYTEQADHAKALERLATARDDALEEAAKVCDAMNGKYFFLIGITHVESKKHIYGAKSAAGIELAAAIRALRSAK